MIAALLLLPTAAALLSLLLRGTRSRRGLLLATALCHAALATGASATPPSPALGGWLALDPLSRLFLPVTSGLFLVVSAYVIGQLKDGASATSDDSPESRALTQDPEAVFVACLLFFLGSMTLVILSQHLGLLWVAVEATTLASAPLIYYHRHQGSLEATWKYLLICSVGIALALLGTFFLAIAASAAGEGELYLPSLIAEADHLDPAWLRGAFLLMLVGYGTKMGLAPLHTWLPDAHSESPSGVSALLSGALLNCAFLGILRPFQLLVVGGQEEFGAQLLVVFGLLSMGFGAGFMLRQTDYKRLLAYSSVEHMGILSLGVGLGGIGPAGSMLHLVNHSLAKALLFLVAGNILAAYRTRSITKVRGVLTVRPVSGALWLVGLLAIAGSPPFGTFFGELLVLKSALVAGQWLIATLFLGFLALAFLGLSHAMLGMAQGLPRAELSPPRARESWLAVAPPAVFATLVLGLGSFIPEPLSRTVTVAARSLGGVGLP